MHIPKRNLPVVTLITTALLITLSGCVNDTTHSPTPAPSRADAAEVASQAPERDLDEGDHATIQQHVSDPNGPNFIVAGGAFADVVGADGEPDDVVGRLINGGEGIALGSTNENGWLVLGPMGQLSFLDEDGRRLDEQRSVIENQSVGFVALGKRRATTGDLQSAWLVGGGEGRVQLVDLNGQPELNIKAQVLMGAEKLVAGAFSGGAEQWLLGSESGTLVALDNMLTPVTSDATFAGKPIGAIVGNLDESSNNRWVVASGSQIAYYPNPTPLDLGAGVDITAASTAAGKLIIGTADGRVATWDFDALNDSPQFVEVFDGQRINAFFFNDTDWIALGDNGHARILGVDGAPTGEATVVGDGSSLQTARWAKDRWLIGTAGSFVVTASADLSLTIDYPEPLGGAEILGADPGGEVVAIVGEGGKFATTTDRGEPISGVKTSPAGNDLMAASYNGTNFFIGGAGGDAYVIDPAGEQVGDAYSLLDGRDIHTASWNGNFWLVAGAEGYIERVRPDGTSVGQPMALPGFDAIHHARWSGSEWMVVGEFGGQGAFQIIGSDGMKVTDAAALARMERVNAASWSGREWLLGGNDGLVQIVSSAGTPRDQPAGQPKDVLSGAEIFAIDFHDNQFLVAGDRGLVRIVQSDLLSPRPAAAAAGFASIRSVRWSRARGFSRGACLTNDKCYVGACLGGNQRSGFCCDSTCDGACESCFGDDTNAPDGVCSPLMAGAEPVTPGGCEEQDAASCGTTGLCDGAGACALHGADVECAGAMCAGGSVTPARQCDGQGVCVEAESTSCEPFAGCDGAECATSCAEDEDCLGELVCEAGMCVEMMEPEPVMEPEPTPEEGCCAVVRPRQAPGNLPLAALLGLFLLARRRRRA